MNWSNYKVVIDLKDFVTSFEAIDVFKVGKLFKQDKCKIEGNDNECK